jgi:hypothetical protein
MSYASLLSGAMHFIKFYSRLEKLISQPSFTWCVTQGKVRRPDLYLLTGNSECDSLAYSLLLEQDRAYFALPLASTNFAQRNIDAFGLKRLPFWYQLPLLLLLVSLSPLVVVYLSAVALLEISLSVSSRHGLLGSYALYCLKSLPYNVATYGVVRAVLFKIRPRRLVSANNIDSNLSIFSLASYRQSIPHVVLQCTSLERVSLPNYCDCDEYWCESSEYASFLSHYISESNPRCILRYPSPSVFQFLNDLTTSSNSGQGEFSTNYHLHLRPTYYFGLPTQAEFLDLSTLIRAFGNIVPLFVGIAEIRISVRLHPRESREKLDMYNRLVSSYSTIFAFSSEASLALWMSRLDLVVGSSSTVMYWAQQADVPLISVLYPNNLYLKGLLPHIPEESIEFTTLSDLEFALYIRIMSFIIGRMSGKLLPAGL